MNELQPVRTYSDLSTLSPNDQTIKDYFEFEIKEREAVIKKLSKYTAALDYTDKTLIVLSATSEGISIISLTNVIGIPALVIKKLLANKETIKRSKKEEEKT